VPNEKTLKTTATEIHC